MECALLHLLFVGTTNTLRVSTAQIQGRVEGAGGPRETAHQFPSPTWHDSQFPVIAAPGESDASGLHGTCAHMYSNYIQIHII